MKIYKVKDYEQMSRKAANIIASQIIMKPNCVLGLATGSSPIGCYKELIEKYKLGDIDFSHVTTVNLDEYIGLSPDNPQSYSYFMNDNLFQHININKANINIPNGLEKDGEKECARYEEVIESSGGIDLQLLGLGLNGHIGFNEPSESFSVLTNQIDLTQSTINANKRFFEKEEDVPKQAYTMGIGTIMKARKILLIAAGADKAEIVKSAFFGPVSTQVPASILQLHADVSIICDEPALSRLSLS